MIKQALVTVAHTLQTLAPDSENGGTGVWAVDLLVGWLDGCRKLHDDAAHTAWSEGSETARLIVSEVASEDTIYALGLCAADAVSASMRTWPAADFWISPPRPAIPVGTPEHDAASLRASGYSLSASVCGDVLRRVGADSFLAEDWWPVRWGASSTALTFRDCSEPYPERINRALQNGDYDSARSLMLFAPLGGEQLDVSTFRSRPEMLDSATVYVAAGAFAKSVVSAHFYSKRIGLSTFLASLLHVLRSREYACYRSNGIRTFVEWAERGTLPRDLKPLCEDDVGA